MQCPEEIVAAAAVPPDYAMLRATLAAGQATRPTARLATRPSAGVDPHAAIHAIVAGEAAGLAAAARALGHRFAAPLPAGHLVNKDERPLYRGISAFLESRSVEAPPATGKAPGAPLRAADRG